MIFLPSVFSSSLGELVIPGPNAFDAVKHVSRAILPISIHTSINARHATIRIPWTKTTGIEGADVSVTARDLSTCPLAALVRHLESNLNIPSHAPLFSFETASGSWAPMTKPWFMARCNSIWVAAGHPAMPGHAFRIGGATELLLEGVPPDVVATQGRWKSRAFLDYWRRIESILPLFISAAINSPLALARLQSVMHDFQRSHNLLPTIGGSRT